MMKDEYDFFKGELGKFYIPTHLAAWVFRVSGDKNRLLCCLEPEKELEPGQAQGGGASRNQPPRNSLKASKRATMFSTGVFPTMLCIVLNT